MMIYPLVDYLRNRMNRGIEKDGDLAFMLLNDIPDK